MALRRVPDSARVPSSRPKRSSPPPLYERPSASLSVFQPVLTFTLNTRSSGTRLVRISTLPPPNAAGISGEKPFCTANESMMSAGKMSSGNTLRVKSGEGTAAPLSWALE